MKDMILSERFFRLKCEEVIPYNLGKEVKAGTTTTQ